MDGKEKKRNEVDKWERKYRIASIKQDLNLSPHMLHHNIGESTVSGEVCHILVHLGRSWTVIKHEE